MELDSPAEATGKLSIKERLQLQWDKLDKKAFASTLVAAAIGFGSAVVGANMTRAADESMQFKQAKQTQYGQVLAGINRDVETYISIVTSLKNDDIKTAVDRIHAHQAAENIGFSQTSVLFLYPNDEISTLALGCVNASSSVSVSISTSIGGGQIKEGDSADGVANRVLKEVNDLQMKASSLRNKMREDLDFPK